MKKYKYVLNTMLYYDYEYLENLLNKMAARGWELCEIGTIFFKFKQVEIVPKKFAVVYDKDSILPEFVSGEESLTFDEYCAAAGWEKLIDSNQIKVFQTTDLDAVPIETDESIRLERIKKALGKSFVPTHVILGLFTYVLLLIVWDAHNIDSLPINMNGPLYVLSHWDRLFVIGLTGLFPIVVFSRLIAYKAWFSRSKRNIESGGKCASTKYVRLFSGLGIGAILLVLFSLLTVMMIQGYREEAFSLVLCIMIFFFVSMIVRKVAGAIKKNGSLSGEKSFVIYALCFIILLTNFAGGRDDAISEGDSTAAAPNKGTIFFYTDSSFTSGGDLYYELCEVRAGFLKGWALKQMLTHYDYGTFVKVHEPQWNADEVYRFVVDEKLYKARFERPEDIDYDFLERVKYRRLLVKDNYLIYSFADRVPTKETFIDQVI